MASEFMQRENAEAYQLMEEMARLSLSEARSRIRQGLMEHGTNVSLNDSHPTGDGDQSAIQLDHTGRQFYRDLFAIGGDINNIINEGLDRVLTPFACNCILGNALRVKLMLESSGNGQDAATPSQSLMDLLETRETSMRLSPLLMVISMGKNMQSLGSITLDDGQLEVVKLLLRYGARPDARDVCGKTVCHYGMGNMATNMTMDAVDMCMEAHKSSHMFGKEVELHSLKNRDMNGKRGIARGLVFDTGRRAVFLYGTQEIVCIKPENLKLVQDDDEENNSDRPKLCDIQDRVGGVCLHELMMGDRVDVANRLLQKHHPRVDIADWDDISPKSMSLTSGAGIVSRVCPLVQKYVMQQGRREMKAAKGHCSRCGKTNVVLRECGLCRKVQYCSKDCQAKDWKEGGHKAVCEPAVGGEGIVINEPRSTGMFSSAFNFQSRSMHSAGGYRKPRNVAVGEKFYIKVQAGGPATPLLIYNKTRECETTLSPDDQGFQVLYNKVRSETATQGRKSYIKASFDAAGKMTVYPNESTIKSTW